MKYRYKWADFSHFHTETGQITDIFKKKEAPIAESLLYKIDNFLLDADESTYDCTIGSHQSGAISTGRKVLGIHSDLLSFSVSV